MINDQEAFWKSVEAQRPEVVRQYLFNVSKYSLLHFEEEKQQESSLGKIL